MDRQEKRNLFIAVLLTTLVMLGWNIFFDKPKQTEAPAPVASAATQGTAPMAANAPSAPLNRSDAVKSGERITLETPKLSGSINLKGAQFDDLLLKDYREAVKTNSPQVDLLSPQSVEKPYWGQFGWVSADPSLKLPSADTLWKSSNNKLTPSTPVLLSWDNGQGMIFELEISVDEEYVFTVKQRVKNNTGRPIAVQPYGLLSRATPETAGYMILHEGPLGFMNQKLHEVTYKDLKKEGKSELNATGGWFGITDKYWLTALIPDRKSQVKVRFLDASQGGRDDTQVDFLGAAVTVADGQMSETSNHLFAGAKVLEVLDAYEVKLGIEHFDKAVDFGWFYFITKPIFYALNWFKDYLGNFGLAILLFTVILKILFFPLANKSYRSMGKMKKLQPEMKRIQEVYKDDRLRMNQEMMELYKREKVNPMAGCLPMLIQIPVFFALYKVLFVSIEMRQAPFFGWIQDLSQPDPTSLFNLFGLIPWDPPSFLMIGIWPLIMGLSMYLQQKLNPPPTDPTQAKVFAFMPLIFTFMLAQFPAGLVIYWTWNNVLSIAQQWTIMNLHAEDKPSRAKKFKR